MIASCETYSCVISTLEGIYVKPKSVIFARHKLTTGTQQPSKLIDQYVQALKLLAKDCNFKAITAQNNESDLIQGSFIVGLRSAQIRQRLLGNLTLPLDEAQNKARALESAVIQAESFNAPSIANAPSHAAATNNNSHNNKVQQHIRSN